MAYPASASPASSGGDRDLGSDRRGGSRRHHREVRELAEVPDVRPLHVPLERDAEAVAAGGVARRAVVDPDVARQAQQAFDAGQGSERCRPLREELRAEVGAAEGEQVRRTQPERAQQQGGDEEGDQDRLPLAACFYPPRVAGYAPDQIGQRHDHQAEHGDRGQRGRGSTSLVVDPGEEHADRPQPDHDAEHEQGQQPPVAVPDVAPVDRVQDVAEGDAPQQDEWQRDVNGVLGSSSGGEAPQRERRYPPAGEQSKRIAAVTPIADDGGDGEEDGDRFIDEQRHEEERRRLAAAFRQEPPPGAKCFADPCDTGRVGEEAGESRGWQLPRRRPETQAARVAAHPVHAGQSRPARTVPRSRLPRSRSP